MKSDYMQWGIFGAVAGALAHLLLPILSKLLSAIPGLSVNLNAVSITGNISGSINTGLSAWAQQALGLIPMSFSLPTMLYTAIGGALAAIIGAFVAEKLGLLGSNKTMRVATVFVFGSLAVTALLAMQLPNLGGEFLKAFITLAVDALALGFILVKVDEAAGFGLVP